MQPDNNAPIKIQNSNTKRLNDFLYNLEKVVRIHFQQLS